MLSGFGPADKIQRPTITHDQDKTMIWFESGYICLDDKHHQYFYVIEAPPIKNIVFSGGGARGILYAGVVSAFEEFHPCLGEKNFLSQIDTVSGASIGSVFAASMALGMQAKELSETHCIQDLEKLLGKGVGPIKRSGEPLFNLLQKTFPLTIMKRISEIADMTPGDSTPLDAFLSAHGKTLDREHQTILLRLQNELQQPLPVITFSMLKVLHHLFPEVFKELYIAVVCKEDGKLSYLSHETSPDLDIALACRASVAVPIILEPVKIHKKYIHPYAQREALPDMLHFVDGGYLDNVPFSIVEEKQKKERGHNQGEYNQNLQTLIILFDDSVASDANEDGTSLENPVVKHYPQSPFLNARSFVKHELTPITMFDFIYNTIPRTLGGIKSNVTYTLNREKDYEQVRHSYAQRNIPLQPAFSSGNFEKAAKCAQQTIEKSKQSTLAYLTNHQGECVYHSYTSFNELIKNLPDDKVKLLIRNKKNIPCLNNRQISVVDKRSNFSDYFQLFSRAYQALSPVSSLLREVMRHVDLIHNDLHASLQEKLVRMIAVSLDYYPLLMKSIDHQALTHLFNKQFKKYIECHYLSAERGQIDFTHPHLCTEKKALHIFKQAHPFYMKFQRIMFLLRQTPSSFINPDDSFRRRFIETIMNELRDIASFHLPEAKKLKKMEDYLYVSYYKLLFYQAKNTGLLARTLKSIIESPAGLNLPYQYGIILPAQVNALPAFIAHQKNSGHASLLEKKYKTKNKVFIKKLFEIIQGQSLLFSAMMHNHFPADISRDKLACLDKVKMQAMTVSFLSSPHQDEKKQADYLYKLIVPADLDKHKKNHWALFTAMSLLVQLSWTKPLPLEKALYEQLARDVHDVAAHYVVENESKAQLTVILRKAYQDLQKAALDAGCYVFFKQPSALYQLIKVFVASEAGAFLNENLRADTRNLANSCPDSAISALR